MLLSDCGIFSPKIDSSNNLVFTIKLKQEDWNEATKELIYLSYNEGKTLDFEIVGMDHKNDEIPKLRQRLALVMNEYVKKTKTSEETLINSFYIRYNIKSRTELTREQLEEAIRYYSDGILYDSNF